MESKKNLKSLTVSDHIYNILLCLLYAGPIYYALIKSTTIKLPFMTLALYGILILLVIYALFMSKHGLKFFLALIFILPLLIILFRIYVDGWEYVWASIYDFFMRIFYLIVGIERLEESAELMIALAICVLIVLFTVIFLAKHMNFFLLTFLGMTIFIVQMLTGNFKSEVAFVLYLIAMCIIVFRRVNLKTAKEKGAYIASPYKFAYAAIPVSLIIALLSYNLPYHDGPLVGYNVGSLTNSSYFQNEEGMFELDQTGFNEGDTYLGGPVRLNNNKVMELKSPVEQYLTGSIKDVYTGYSWSFSDQAKNEYKEELALSSIETLYAMERNENTKGNVKEINSAVTLYDLRTRSIFQPLMFKRIASGSFDKLWIDINEKLFSNRYMDTGFKYSFDNYVINPNFMSYGMPGYSYEGYYDDMLLAGVENSTYEVDGSAFEINMERIEQLSSRAKRIYDQYLQLPDTLPDRVRQKAREITSSANNNPYSMAKEIEQYLAHNYRYNLDAPAPPSGSDFVDYFLFELDEGYCVYYASAMTVMCRAVGLPARYVEGFGPTERKADGTYDILNQNAHAWSEVYFEGFGWVRFEPTAPYMFSGQGEEIPDDVFSPNMLENPAYSDYMDSLFERNDQAIESTNAYDEITSTTRPNNTSNSSRNQSNSDSQTTRPRGSNNSKNSQEEDENGGLLAFLLVAALVIAAIAILIRIRQRKLQLELIPKLENRESVIAYFEEICKMTAYDNNPILNTESMTQYADRMSEKYQLRIGNWGKAAEIFEKVRYSATAVPSSDKEYIKRFYEEIESILKGKNKTLKFLFARYIQHKI